MNSRLMKHQYAHTIPLERRGRSLLRRRVYTLQTGGPGFQARRVGRPVTNVPTQHRLPRFEGTCATRGKIDRPSKKIFCYFEQGIVMRSLDEFESSTFNNLVQILAYLRSKLSIIAISRWFSFELY